MCDVFDRRTQYTNIRTSNNKWLVVHKQSLDDSIKGTWDPKRSHKSIQFIRLRCVKIDSEGFMSCSCEFPSRWLLPCAHICNVLYKSDYFIPELIHLRWWKHFNCYLYKNKASQERGTSQKKIETLEYVRSHHYCLSTEKYKGVPLHNNKFLSDVAHQGFCMETNYSNQYYHEILAIHKLKM